jgi:hypothetical protein
MGRVITGRGDVFNYKTGETTELARSLKPYDFEKVLRNAQRGMAVTKDIEKTSLLASGSPIVQGVGAVADLGKQGAQWAGRQLGLIDPAQPSERDKLAAITSRASARGLLPKPPAAPPVPTPEGGAVVRQPPAARVPREPLDSAMARPEETQERLNELLRLQREAITPNMAASYQEEIDRLRSLIPERRGPVERRPLVTPQPAAAAPPPAVPPAAAAPPAAAPQGFSAAQAQAMGPETAALYQSAESENVRKQRAYAEAVRRAEQAQGASTAGLTGQELVNSPAFNRKLRAVAQRIGADPQDLLRVFGVESNMRPNDPPPEGSSAAGLIQIIDKRARQMGTTSEAIRALNPFEQLDWAEKYLTLPEIASKADYSRPMQADLAVFAPAGLGQPDNFVLYEQGDGNYGPNAGVDLNSDGKITVGERRQWSQRHADKQGYVLPPDPGPPPAVPQPQGMDVTPDELMARRGRVDSGMLVIPNVRPQRVNFGNLSIMARNSASDAQKNWVRSLIYDNETELPWRNLSDLFTGEYKRRASKELEAMFPVAPKPIDALTQSKIDKNLAAAGKARAETTKIKRGPKAPVDKTDKWKPYYTQIGNKEKDLRKRRSEFEKLRANLQQPRFMAGELRIPEQGQYQSKAEHEKTVEWFKKIQGDMEANRDKTELIKDVDDMLLMLAQEEAALEAITATANEFRNSNPRRVPRAFIKRHNSFFRADLTDPVPQVKRKRRKKPVSPASPPPGNNEGQPSDVAQAKPGVKVNKPLGAIPVE